MATTRIEVFLEMYRSKLTEMVYAKPNDYAWEQYPTMDDFVDIVTGRVSDALTEGKSLNLGKGTAAKATLQELRIKLTQRALREWLTCNS